MGDQKVENSVTSNGSGTHNPAMVIEPVPEKRRKNKYAFGCAMLASMTSILLGYGECSTSPFLVVKDQKISHGFLFLRIEEMILFLFQMRFKEI